MDNHNPACISNNSILEVPIGGNLKFFLFEDYDAAADQYLFDAPKMVLNHPDPESEAHYAFRVRLLPSESFVVNEVSGFIPPRQSETLRVFLEPKKWVTLLRKQQNQSSMQSTMLQDEFLTVEIDLIPSERLRDLSHVHCKRERELYEQFQWKHCIKVSETLAVNYVFVNAPIQSSRLLEVSQDIFYSSSSFVSCQQKPLDCDDSTPSLSKSSKSTATTVSDITEQNHDNILNDSIHPHHRLSLTHASEADVRIAMTQVQQVSQEKSTDLKTISSFEPIQYSHIQKTTPPKEILQQNNHSSGSENKDIAEPQAQQETQPLLLTKYRNNLDELPEHFKEPMFNKYYHTDPIITSKILHCVEVAENSNQQSYKLVCLLQKIKKDVKKALVFVKNNSEANLVKTLGKNCGWRTQKINNWTRQTKVLSKVGSFTSGNIQLLVTTDKALRQLDPPNVDCVINYSFPSQVGGYTLRSSRINQAKHHGGVVYTIFNSETDRIYTSNMIQILQHEQQPIPNDLRKLLSKVTY